MIDHVVRSQTSDGDYITSVVRRVYNNRFTKVLIVDDSSSYRQYLRSLLRTHLYPTIEADRADEALYRAKHQGRNEVVVD